MQIDKKLQLWFHKGMDSPLSDVAFWDQLSCRAEHELAPPVDASPLVFCSSCQDAPASNMGCRICHAAMCVSCLAKCDICGGFYCPSHGDLFAHPRFRSACRACAAQVYGYGRLEPFDEAYRLHRLGIVMDAGCCGGRKPRPSAPVPTPVPTPLEDYYDDPGEEYEPGGELEFL